MEKKQSSFFQRWKNWRVKRIYASAERSRARGDHSSALNLYIKCLKFQNQPKVIGQSAVTAHKIGRQYAELGIFQQAETFLQAAISGLKSDEVDYPTLRIALAQVDLAGVFMMTDRNDEADRLLTLAESVFKETLSSTDREMLRLLSTRAVLKKKKGELKESAELHSQILNARESILPPGHREISESRCNLGLSLTLLGAYKEAELLLRLALEEDERRHPKNDHAIAADIDNLALLLIKTGRNEEALRLRARLPAKSPSI